MSAIERTSFFPHAPCGSENVGDVVTDLLLITFQPNVADEAEIGGASAGDDLDWNRT